AGRAAGVRADLASVPGRGRRPVRLLRAGLRGRHVLRDAARAGAQPCRGALGACGPRVSLQRVRPDCGRGQRSSRGVQMTATPSHIGTSIARAGLGAMVTGSAEYTADLKRPGMLDGKTLRSPHAHARNVSIDAARALALPGVHAVGTY